MSDSVGFPPILAKQTFRQADLSLSHNKECFRVRRVLVGLFAASLLLAACGGGGDTEEPTAVVTATRETPTVTPDPAPLTGVPVSSPTVLDRPVVAVKIDNASQARPQVGLDVADIVFEEVVEGGATRFLALFQSQAPGSSAGPVRSGRDVEAELLLPYHPLLVISGAAPPTLQVLRAAGLPLREEGQPEHAFHRDRARKRPYNLFVDVDAMWEVARAEKIPAAAPAWPFGESTHGQPAVATTMSFSPSMQVRWEWDGAKWLREQSRSAHMSANGDQIAAENVVVVMVGVTAGGGVDVAGSATQEIQVIGEGDAVIFRDGKAIQGLWRKSVRETHFEFVTKAGAVVPLAVGRTWIELLPIGSALDIQRPAISPSPSASTSQSPRPSR